MRCGAARVLGFPTTLVLLAGLACSGDDSVTGPPVAPPSDPPELSGEISGHCYRWPEATFTKRNFAPVETSLGVGDRAVDFELRDAEGGHHRLADLLTEKPVLLVLGSYT